MVSAKILNYLFLVTAFKIIFPVKIINGFLNKICVCMLKTSSSCFIRGHENFSNKICCSFHTMKDRPDQFGWLVKIKSIQDLLLREI